MSAFIVTNLSDFGAVPDAVLIVDATIAAASPTLTSATAPFAAGDVGKTIVVAGAGASGAPLRTTIAAFTSAGQVVLTDNAVTAVSNQGASFGTDCSTALQDGLDALAAAGGGTLEIDGHYLVAGHAAVDFQAVANAIRITGSGSNSAIFVATSTLDPMIRIANALDLIVRDVNFVGTPGVKTDAFQVIKLETSFAKFKNCGFFGLSSTEQTDGALIFGDRTYLGLEENYFAGCTANNALGASVVTNRNWGGFTSKRNRFVDLGLFNGILHNKLAGLQVSPLAWVRLEGVNSNETQENAFTHGVARFEDDRMDEFALRCIVVDPPSGIVPHVLIDGVRFNVPRFLNPQGCAVQIADAESVEIRRAYFGFVQTQQTPVLLNNCSRVLIDRVRCNEFATGLIADDVTSLVLRNSPDFDPAHFSFTGVASFSLIADDVGGVVPFSKSGAIADSDFAAPPPIGTLAVDRATGDVYVKTQAAGGWKQQCARRDWNGWAPAISATSGTLGAHVVNVAGYKLVDGDICHVHLDVSITDNGTGGVSVRATMPFAASQTQVLPGREEATTGMSLMGQLTPNSNVMTIQAYDNSYPGANGRRLILSGSYRIA